MIVYKLSVILLTPGGGGEAQPSVMACSVYMKLWSSVLLGSASWNVAYGEMSSDVSKNRAIGYVTVP